MEKKTIEKLPGYSLIYLTLPAFTYTYYSTWLQSDLFHFTCIYLHLLQYLDTVWFVTLLHVLQYLDTVWLVTLLHLLQ